MRLNLARRKLLAALGSAAVAWALVARAQQRTTIIIGPEILSSFVMV